MVILMGCLYVMWVKQCHFYHNLGMVNIPPILTQKKMVMTGLYDIVLATCLNLSTVNYDGISLEDISVDIIIDVCRYIMMPVRHTIHCDGYLLVN